ncbi:hypothetical protein OROMI_011341 [Orobanche minor]
MDSELSIVVLLSAINSYNGDHMLLISSNAAENLHIFSKCNYNPEIDHDFQDDENSLLSGLPEDVKKGHFVARTIYGGESRRVVVELSYLAHPGFLKLFEQAEQEFGFKQTE